MTMGEAVWIGKLMNKFFRYFFFLWVVFEKKEVCLEIEERLSGITKFLCCLQWVEVCQAESRRNEQMAEALVPSSIFGVILGIRAMGRILLL